MIRDGQYRDTCIGDTYRAILLYRYFCIGIALATFQSIVYRYRLTHILRIADTCIADTNFTVT